MPYSGEPAVFGSILGHPVRRVEDPALLRGTAEYVDNLRIDGALILRFVRSPLAHGRITGIDVSVAESMPGVHAVYTAETLGLTKPLGFALNPDCPRLPLATGKVRFVGEPVAVVVADTTAQAEDAVSTVDVGYEPLDPVVDVERALEPGAPLVFDNLDNNVGSGTRQTHEALADADTVVAARLVNQRIAVAPMEGNAIAALPGVGEHELTVYVSTQMPHRMADELSQVFDVDRERVRVSAPDVGGGFGGKTGLIAEYAVTAAAARNLGRPVKWVETRSENLVSMPHGRGQVQYVQLGLKNDGTITGMRARMIGESGAYGGFGGFLVQGPTRVMAQGVYRIPALAYDAMSVFTNTTPFGAFRGAGRPEAAAMLERVMDIAAAELGIDPVEIRRRNFIAPEEFPYRTKTGAHYDSGEYDRALTEALRIAGYDELRAEQAARRERGERTVLGIGVSCYVEITAAGGAAEFGAVEVHDDGSATVRAGSSGHGQGHPTAFAMIVADRLGIPMEAIDFVQSDTALVPRGGGTVGSRSLQTAGSAARQAADVVLDEARKLAAEEFEADPSDIVVDADAGGLAVAGVPGASLTWKQLVVLAAEQGSRLAAEADFEQGASTFPFGAHVSVVEVDTDTGYVRPLRHIAVDDCGRVLNPMLVAGQQHGGLAQGIAQALWEGFTYDEDGNPATGTFADYVLPTAADLFDYEVSGTVTPSPRNPLGVKGIGEAATIGGTPAVQNAVVDALAHLGVRHVDMPCTPQRVWRAIRDAQNGASTPLWTEPSELFETLPVRE